jgi:hypothetical protein
MATFETTIGNPSREFMARITTTDAIPVVYEDVNIGSIEHIGSLVSGSAFEIGTAIAGRVTIEIVNNDGEYTGHTFENKEFKVEIGLKGLTCTRSWVISRLKVPERRKTKQSL